MFPAYEGRSIHFEAYSDNSPLKKKKKVPLFIGNTLPEHFLTWRKGIMQFYNPIVSLLTEGSQESKKYLWRS